MLSTQKVDEIRNLIVSIVNGTSLKGYLLPSLRKWVFTIARVTIWLGLGLKKSMQKKPEKKKDKKS